MMQLADVRGQVTKYLYKCSRCGKMKASISPLSTREIGKCQEPHVTNYAGLLAEPEWVTVDCNGEYVYAGTEECHE